MFLHGSALIVKGVDLLFFGARELPSLNPDRAGKMGVRIYFTLCPVLPQAKQVFFACSPFYQVPRAYVPILRFLQARL